MALTSEALAQIQKAAPAPSVAGSEPNILVSYGDDIGMANISGYSGGNGV